MSNTPPTPVQEQRRQQALVGGFCLLALGLSLLSHSERTLLAGTGGSAFAAIAGTPPRPGGGVAVASLSRDTLPGSPRARLGRTPVIPGVTARPPVPIEQLGVGGPDEAANAFVTMPAPAVGTQIPGAVPGNAPLVASALPLANFSPPGGGGGGGVLPLPGTPGGGTPGTPGNPGPPTPPVVDPGTGTPPTGVPEPSSWALMILGFGAIATALRRRVRVAPSRTGRRSAV